MRPNFFVNTPDILHAYLQHGGPAAFKIRAVLASMLSPSWGVYSGYELYEHQAVRPGSEEYLDSEKYQYRPRNWAQPSLAGYLGRLNEIRRAHPALHWLRNLRFHLADSPDIIAFSKQAGEDAVLVLANLNPHETRDTFVHLWMPASASTGTPAPSRSTTSSPARPGPGTGPPTGSASTRTGSRPMCSTSVAGNRP
jgi:starch synthase (maltosyl-transferring)